MRVRNSKRLLLAVLLALVAGLVVNAAFAQETTAGLQGTVKDPTGAVIAKATVEVSSPTLIGVKKMETDPSGNYRFANLPPGTYTLVVTAPNFRSYKQENIELATGHLPTIEIVMQLGAAAETVEVSGAAPLVDVTQSKVQTNVSEEVINAVPKGRSYQDLINFAPGSRNEPLMGGFQIDGASKSENAYLVEGQDTTNIQHGTADTNVPIEFIQEVQVKSSGFEAEYGGALGGVVNVIQKRGSNTWHGSVWTYYDGDGTHARPTGWLQYVPNTDVNGRFDQPTQYYQPKADAWHTIEPGFEIGGSVLKNRWWVYGSYAPRFYDVNRTVSLAEGTKSFGQDSRRYYSYARTDVLVTQKIRAWGAIQYNYARAWGTTLPTQDSMFGQFNSDSENPSSNWPYKQGWVAPNVIYNSGADITINPNLVATTRVGRSYYDYQDRGKPSGDRYRWNVSATASTLVLDGSTLPGAYQQPVGTANMPDNTMQTYNKFARLSWTQDLAWFKRGAGTHNFKFGYALNRLSNKDLYGYNTSYIRLYYGRAFPVLPSAIPTCQQINAQNLTNYNTIGLGSANGSSCMGDYGYYVIRQYGEAGKVASNNHAFYLQDAWTIKNRLTVNAGVRFDKESLPSYDTRFRGIEFGFGQKAAPRIGASYDLLGTGKVKLFGSYGWFFDIMKYSLPLGSFGGAYWHDCTYAMDDPDPTKIHPTVDASGHYCPLTGPAVGQTTGRFIQNQDFREPSNDPSNYLVDPNLKPMKQHEYVAGVDWAVKPNIALEVRYSRKRLDRTIEDSGIVTPNGEQFYITNPGMGINFNPIPATDCTGCPPNPKANRSYDAVEFRLTKRASNNWYGQFTYTYSRLYGNYEGLATADQGDSLGRADPNNNRSFDEPYMQFSSSGKVIDGPLATDRPNTFKMFGYYNLKWLGMNTLIGMSQQIFQGTPLSAYMILDGGAPQFVGQRGQWVDISQDASGAWTAGAPYNRRTPWFTQTDLNFQHEVKLSKAHESLRAGFEVNITNLFNQRSVLNLDSGNMPASQYWYTGTASSSITSPAVPATSISGVNYKALMTGYDWVVLANTNDVILSSLYGKADVWQDGRGMRFKFKFSF